MKNQNFSASFKKKQLAIFESANQSKFHYHGSGKLNILLALLFSVTMFSAAAQKILPEYDSIPVTKSKLKNKTYLFNNPLLKEISIVNGKPKAVSENPNKFWKNLAGGTLTMFTGISTGTSGESIWVTENQLKTANSEYECEVHFFFAGEYSKTRERIKNDDGSSSIETEKGIYIDWSKQTYGFITEKHDTIGEFTLLTDLYSDIESNKWLSKMENESTEVRSSASKFLPAQMLIDFKITGFYKGKYFKIIISGKNYKSLILFDSKPVAIFQDEPGYVFLGRKNRIEKYLLHEKMISDTEIVDLFRLSLLSRLLATIAGDNYYEM